MTYLSICKFMSTHCTTVCLPLFPPPSSHLPLYPTHSLENSSLGTTSPKVSTELKLIFKIKLNKIINAVLGICKFVPRRLADTLLSCRTKITKNIFLYPKWFGILKKLILYELSCTLNITKYSKYSKSQGNVLKLYISIVYYINKHIKPINIH